MIVCVCVCAEAQVYTVQAPINCHGGHTCTVSWRQYGNSKTVGPYVNLYYCTSTTSPDTDCTVIAEGASNSGSYTEWAPPGLGSFYIRLVDYDNAFSAAYSAQFSVTGEEHWSDGVHD